MEPYQYILGKCLGENLHQCCLTCPLPSGQDRKGEAGGLEEQQSENHLNVCQDVLLIYQSLSRPLLGDGAQNTTKKAPYLMELRFQLERQVINRHPPKQMLNKSDDFQEK